MLYYTTLPRPSLGDVYTRVRDSGDVEVAMVVAIQTRQSDEWAATLMCSTGQDTITGAPERRGFDSWFPKGWVYDNDINGFRPPNHRWDDSLACFVAEDRGESEQATAVPGNPTGGQTRAHATRNLVAVPVIPGEMYAAWLARVRRANRDVDLTNIEVKARLRELWGSRQTGAPPPDTSPPPG